MNLVKSSSRQQNELRLKYDRRSRVQNGEVDWSNWPGHSYFVVIFLENPLSRDGARRTESFKRHVVPESKRQWTTEARDRCAGRHMV